MRYLRLISIAMTAGGIVLAAVSQLFDRGALVTLIGLMLAIAGLVKIITVAVWHGIAGLGPIEQSDNTGAHRVTRTPNA